MLRINRLRSLSNLVPRIALLSIYHSFIRPIFNYDSVVCNTCPRSDALLLDTAPITAAIIITGRVKTTASDTVLKDIYFVELSNR